MNWRNRPRLSDPEVCENILPLLSLQADGMASDDESRRVELHLKACDDCRRAQSWMQATHLAIAQRPLVAPPPDLRARIAQAVAAQAAPVVFTTPRRPLVLRPVFALAASLALAAAWVGHSLLTARTTAPGVEPTTVANVPHNTTPPSVPPARSVTAPPKVAVKPAMRAMPHVSVKPIERVATTKDTAAPLIVAPPPSAPLPAPRSAVRSKNTSSAPLIVPAPPVVAPTPVKAHPATPAPKAVHLAAVPKAAPPNVTTPDVTPPPAVSPEPSPTVAAVQPETPAAPAQNPEIAPVRVAHRDDALSAVRAHLTSSRSDNTPRQISLDRSARIRSASYGSGDSLTPYYGMVYSDTALPRTPTHQDH